MSKHKLTLDEMKQIAHLMAQRNISAVGSGEYIRATERYLEDERSREFSRIDKDGEASIERWRRCPSVNRIGFKS